ncbi:MAG TPA: diguanylate cyclase [Burkholderiaceae bacterium]|nr:diguanylate cyclase [Burkholderiaceae bacterium]
MHRSRPDVEGISPEQKRVFLREAPAFPAWLLIFLFGGAGAALGRADGWAWIGAAAAIALVRVLIAIRALSPRAPSRGDSLLGVLFIATHLAQAAMWVMLLWTADASSHAEVRIAASLAFAMMLSAACLRGWRAGWLGALAGWGAAAVGLSFGLWDAVPVASVTLLVLLPAIAWAGLGPSKVQQPIGSPMRATRTRPDIPIPAGSTRRGMQLAIHASSAPMIGLHDGRIFELNKSAEAFLGRAADQCVGRPLAELVRLDPPSALDAAYPSVERHALVTPELPGDPDVATAPVRARIRVGRSGGHVAVAVVALTPPPGYAADHELGTDARRLAEWLGADSTEVWYRDETGHLYLPKRFDGGVLAQRRAAADAFPLAMLVPEDERPIIDTLYREQLAAGRTFDERLTLTDADGMKRSVRVVCLSRPGLGRQDGAVIGVVTESAARSVQVWRPDPLSQLPALIWLIDASGRVIHAHSSDVQRWGLRIEPRLRPSWASALALQADSQDAFANAVQRALDGKPTFDLMNYRTGRSGGRMPLRSHFVPFQALGGEGGSRRAVMVMDTIASVRELLEVERLRLSKAQYKDLVEASPNLIWACDGAFRFTFVSRRACRDVYGHTVEELVGKPMTVLLDPLTDQTSTRTALASLRGRALRDVEMAHITKDGRRITVAMSGVALRSPDGNFAGAIGINVDVTALKQREARLAEALRVERSVLDSAGQAIAVVKSGAVARCNDAFLQLLQMRPDELAEVPVADLFAERNHWDEVASAAERASVSDGAVSREIRLRRSGPASAPEQFVWCQITLRAIGEGEYVVAMADIDQIRRREAHAQHDARHDELTGLPNRRLLAERVRAALATSALRNSGCAILVFDLDGFKPINDRYGHAAGDLVLREIARRLQNVVRPQDTVARIGGDEFALLMPDCGSMQDVERIARRILRELAQPLTVADLGGATLTASLGVAMAPEHGRDPEGLMRLADRAMYDAKVDGGDRVMFAGTLSSFADQVTRRAS